MSLVVAPHRPTERLPELRAVLELACGNAELIYHSETDWDRGLYTGKRHIIALRFKGGEQAVFGEAFICELPRHTFALAGKLVADVAIVWTERACNPEPELTLALELLILDEA